ncbi:hypothetical protein FRC0316_00470 [Corynebacterium diphtheriae]|uniref:hypothetical protein n=1 Tax=Corynebacterium diphtheriae TaxID=1717 RepID=UPI0013C79734|nr:hypothetical protein [Corynebacterium diphtheriae]CAB0632292.1 hypothetical protein FRC0016_00397 [Corynebacterium diphtheriae]CAB0788225.1 hypothetical protein FRC0213_00396 [Corynebacterium diphtheriae]CAB0832695.1 hypothetical protein FRC0295_00308 [Corynebacterium diphtheriae]CAB0834462.1 hypothetical protein FRC0316_00470 [Corynebacterium diphtheriae]CAB0850044.1 hypothetical protein FRC0378_00469 [Corynebacterium diphtheriae]
MLKILASMLPMPNAAIMIDKTVDSLPKTFDHEKPPADDPDSEVFESSGPSCYFLVFQSRLIAGLLHRWWLAGSDKFDQGVDLTRVIALVVVRHNDGAMGWG